MKMIEQTIPKADLPIVRERLERLNKKAAKVAAPVVELTVSEPYEVKLDGGVAYMAVDVQIIGDAPKLEGWTFCGTLDHVSLPGKVVVKTVPGLEIPQGFFHNDAVCDHCQKKRIRKDTFIVEKDGEYLQVGRQCVQDFLGHNPAQVLAYLKALDEFTGEFEKGFGGPRDFFFDHVEVLKVTTALIRKYGWVSKREAYESAKCPTAFTVMSYFIPEGGPGSAARREWQEWRDSIVVDEKCEKDAKAAIEWLKTQNGNNEYMHNLKEILDADSVPSKLFGFWCSLIATYNRAMEREIKKQDGIKKIKQEYFGFLKQRGELVLKVIGKQWIDTQFGGSEIHRFQDSEGRLFNWFSSMGTDMEVGNEYKVKATVKRHDEYNGNKITYINRVSVLKELQTCS